MRTLYLAYFEEDSGFWGLTCDFAEVFASVFTGFYLIIAHLGNVSASLSDIGQSNRYKHKESGTGQSEAG
jgi:hypothetical protein